MYFKIVIPTPRYICVCVCVCVYTHTYMHIKLELSAAKVSTFGMYHSLFGRI